MGAKTADAACESVLILSACAGKAKKVRISIWLLTIFMLNFKCNKLPAAYGILDIRSWIKRIWIVLFELEFIRIIINLFITNRTN